MNDLKEFTFLTRDSTINYAEMGSSGPPLVLLHGGGNRWQSFSPIIPSLASKFHVFALDLRGHGKSGRVPGKYRPEHYATDVIAFIKGQVSGDPILFGHSLGGWIALLVAAEQIEGLRGLILGDPPLSVERFYAIEGSEDRISFARRLRDLASMDLPVHELAQELAKLPVSLPGRDTQVKYGDLPGVDADHLREWAETLSQVDPDVVQYHAEGRLSEYIQHIDLDEAMRQVACPVLLLQADPALGGMVSDDDANHALSLFDEASHAKLDGVGHDLGRGSGDNSLLLSVVTDFLSKL